MLLIASVMAMCPGSALTPMTVKKKNTRGVFKKKPVQKVMVSNICLCSSLLGGRCPNLTHIFSNGLKAPTSVAYRLGGPCSLSLATCSHVPDGRGLS